MPVTDTSYLVKNRLLKGKTLSYYKLFNTKGNEFIGSQFLQSEYVIRALGDRFGGCIPPGPVTVTAGDPYGAPFPYDSDPYGLANDITWPAVENATSYTVSAVYEDLTITTPVHIVNTGLLSVSVYYSIGALINVTVTAINICGTSSGTVIPTTACFLAGSLVQMANGSFTPIEDIQVGDLVLGAFGETNTILALHHPLLGSGKMCTINGEHTSTAHHPHVSADKKFYCEDPQKVNTTVYGKYHKVINEKGEVVDMLLHGLKKGRVQQLTVGIELKTVNGSKKVDTIEVYSMNPATQLYNLAVGGSHTYHVDGYAVTGWPREDDFDYDTWTVRPMRI